MEWSESSFIWEEIVLLSYCQILYLMSNHFILACNLPKHKTKTICATQRILKNIETKL